MANPTSKTSDPNFILLYVNDATASARFYGDLLARPPAQAAPTFAAFPLASGVTLGLWTRSDVQPKVAGIGDRAEIGFPAPDAAAVDAMYADWRKRGLPIV